MRRRGAADQKSQLLALVGGVGVALALSSGIFLLALLAKVVTGQGFPLLRILLFTVLTISGGALVLVSLVDRFPVIMVLVIALWKRDFSLLEERLGTTLSARQGLSADSPLEQRVLDLAKANNGRITLAQVSRATRLSQYAAESLLRVFTDRGDAERFFDQGEAVYLFPALVDTDNLGTNDLNSNIGNDIDLGNRRSR
ncbi:MAG: hypothetical protein U5L04_14005 [Trueperaceae bacterium]|nr:hypothetical protein [Trueperaceae bacterium]